MVQVRGVLNRVGGYEVLHTVDTEDVLKAENLADNFEEESEVDFSYVAREVPIEFLYRDYKSIINQQQEAVSRCSYSQASRYVLRQDSNITLIAEIRDP